MAISKGLRSKEEILNQLRNLLNDEGMTFTLSELADKLGTTKGRITYHFPTRDHLFIALGKQYQEQISLITDAQAPPRFGLTEFHELASQIMDLQYTYRSVIRYMAVTARSQDEMIRHLSDNFRKDRTVIEKLFRSFIESGSVTHEILDPEIFRILLFQFTNLFTTWVISLEIYDTDHTYEEMKPVYLNGILGCFQPYLTRQGRLELDRLV